MGAWSVSVTGNDTARDLASEYSAAFFKYEPEQATALIDAYVRENMFDESDEEDWCDYVYSLANYMWKKGILTDEIKARAVTMIDSGFGLELWEEAGSRTLEKRKRALAEFKEKILSPMPPKKKIRLNLNTSRIFEDGDVVAIQLQTAGKPYTENDHAKISDEAFHSYDGKYILLQLVECFASWSSAIVPEVKDYWAFFRLLDGVYDEVPVGVDVNALKPAAINKAAGSSCFVCESSMFYFKRRKYQLVGKRLATGESREDRRNPIFLGVDNSWTNPDSQFLAAMERR